MTETHELNRPVICLRYAARVVTHPVKSPRTASEYRFRRPAPLTLSTARRGALRLSTGVVSDSFFESDTTASEAVGGVVYNKIQLKRTAQTNNYIVGSVSDQPVGQLRGTS